MSVVSREADATAGRSGDVPPAAGPAPVLAVSGLSVVYPSSRRDEHGVAVLDGVSLAVAEGEFVAVLGPSGCGKSTLLRVLGGLVGAGAAVTGSVTVPRDAAGRSATAWMPQRDGLLPWRRALSNAMVGAIAAGVPRERAEPRARDLFEEFGLAGFERAWPHELSGGMRQRLALLRTCLAQQPVQLLDEPFGALDPVTRRRMNAWLAGIGLADRAGSAVVLVTHDIDEAITLADRVLVLSERPGRVVLEARAADGYDREALLASLDATARIEARSLGR